MLKNRTLQMVLEDPAIAAIAPDAISKKDLGKEAFYHWTVQEIADRMGWRSLERGLNRLYEAAKTDFWYFKLYSAEERRGEPAKESASLVYFPSADAEASNRPFVLLVPGGGFVNVWNITEGWPIAQHYNELGYHVFILTYQVGVEGTAVKVMDDMARAMSIIRQRKEAFQVDPDSYLTCGFSAGGYIVCLWNTEVGYPAFGLAKPKACIPVYPVTSYRLLNTGEWDNKDAFARAGVGCTMAEACNSCFEIPLHVEGFPPTAIFATEEDQLVDPEHSRTLARALDAAGIACRIEIGPTGGHGFADGTGMCMEGWMDRAIRWFEQIK